MKAAITYRGLLGVFFVSSSLPPALQGAMPRHWHDHRSQPHQPGTHHEQHRLEFTGEANGIKLKQPGVDLIRIERDDVELLRVSDARLATLRDARRKGSGKRNATKRWPSYFQRFVPRCRGAGIGASVGQPSVGISTVLNRGCGASVWPLGVSIPTFSFTVLPRPLGLVVVCNVTVRLPA